jgi:uncharacterized membrane protein
MTVLELIEELQFVVEKCPECAKYEVKFEIERQTLLDVEVLEVDELVVLQLEF